MTKTDSREQLKIEGVACVLIQELRMVHALSESSYEVALGGKARARFRKLEELSGPLFASMKKGGVEVSKALEFCHESPRTVIAGEERQLVFPHAIVEFCRDLWDGERSRSILFQGRVSASRLRSLSEWAGGNYQGVTLEFEQERRIRKLFNWGRLLQGVHSTREFRHRDLWIVESNRGRCFPIKAWDEEYFRRMAQARFVLCPAGDFTWSYRFVEAIFCGAIPIVEGHCSLFEGFHFYRWEDRVADLIWDQEMADSNLALARERFTIPLCELDRAVASFLACKK